MFFFLNGSCYVCLGYVRESLRSQCDLCLLSNKMLLISRKMIGEKVMMDVFQIYVERIFVIVKFDVIYKLEEIEDIILRLGFVILQVILEILVK